ncbi:hypothetical protein GCM10007978_30240 [Shewanella hanedai]|uniref:Uncharacterized protein n=1 Tax=Shewanella hanedai TaxID=25 RepID=A0A553JKG8_SHEHA|nr:hypothetical protein [Shewanella hanedai]TRY12942.1 hypothetical protein FN961_17720 [Shewanella hanedai]GGI90558.1 hypothetical protein GCM10007978_30240 [Shewanella hanedai]
MKLVGSKTEKEFEAVLIKNTSLVLSHSVNSHLKTFLLENEIDPDQVIVLECFPDDGSIFYLLLIENRLIGRVEVELYAPERTGMDTVTLQEYRHKLSKTQQIKLAVAMNLLRAST